MYNASTSTVLAKQKAIIREQSDFVGMYGQYLVFACWLGRDSAIRSKQNCMKLHIFTRLVPFLGDGLFGSILLFIAIIMQRNARQSSFSRQKTQIMINRQQQAKNRLSKNNTNPPTHEQQVSKELIKKTDDSAYLPVYRVTKTRFEKNNLRFSDNSPLKTKDKVAAMSPYRQQEYQAYNFAHLGPLEHFERKKKGRTYFYKRSQDKKQEMEPQAIKINAQLHSQIQVIQPHIAQVQLIENTTEKKQKEDDMAVQEVHYEMVKTYQKCKKMNLL